MVLCAICRRARGCRDLLASCAPAAVRLSGTELGGGAARTSRSPMDSPARPSPYRPFAATSSRWPSSRLMPGRCPLTAAQFRDAQTQLGADAPACASCGVSRSEGDRPRRSRRLYGPRPEGQLALLIGRAPCLRQCGRRSASAPSPSDGRASVSHNARSTSSTHRGASARSCTRTSAQGSVADIRSLCARPRARRAGFSSGLERADGRCSASSRPQRYRERQR